MLNGEVEETFYPRNPLDVLAQQIVAIVSEGPIPADDVYRLMLSSAPFADLPRSSYDGVLDLLSGRYPSDEFHELRPRINWDRISGELSPRSGSQRVAILNAGTIPDRGLYGVFLLGKEGETNSRVGELDEEMVHEIHPGDVFLSGSIFLAGHRNHAGSRAGDSGSRRTRTDALLERRRPRKTA